MSGTGIAAGELVNAIPTMPAAATAPAGDERPGGERYLAATVIGFQRQFAAVTAAMPRQGRILAGSKPIGPSNPALG